ncbi:Hypothetical protein CINCED_3A022864 [Cinara cedri]|nr:Hypothetical protein CINCED_3A022864 [Cinara cedri]
MAKRVLDLYTLYKLVVQRGGIVAVITKKLWQEIIRGLGLPPSITSAAFTLRTQYVKYLYAYESKMNQFSSVDELNMAIAGNRREGRRNKSLLSEYLPSLPVSVAAGHHMSASLQVSPGSSAAAAHHHHQQQQQQQHQQQQQQQQQQHYANVLAADDRFRHLAAAIIDNRHRVAEQAARQLPPRPSSSSSSPRPGSPQRLVQQLPPTVSAVVESSPFNGHLQPPPYQSASMIAAHQATATEHNNKQREILSMLMWMDLMRANQTAIPRLPIPNLQQSAPSPYAAAAAAALNLSPAVVMQKVPVPEQCEALNLGKKNPAGTNNNNAGENDEESQPPPSKRIKTEWSPPLSLHKVQAVASRPASPKNAAAVSPRPTGSPVRESISSPGRSGGEDDDDDNTDANSDNNMIEMDIDVSAGMPSGLKICVCKRTKHGIYKGQLVKVESTINGGAKNTATSPFILRLNGELYKGCLQLQNNNNLQNHNNDEKNFS